MKSIHRFFDPYDSSTLLRNICREEMKLMGDNLFYIREEIGRNITNHIFLVTNIKLDVMELIRSYL